MEIVKDVQEETGVNMREPELKKTQKPTYDPNKKYRWEPTDNFIISGGDFGVLLNSLRSLLSTPEARLIMLAERANNTVEDALAKAVEQGIVKEAEESKLTKQ